MKTALPTDDDFRMLRQSGLPAGSSKSIGDRFITLRTSLARGLIRLGVTPNHVTVAGFVANCGAAVCLVAGAGHHSPLEAPVPGVAQSTWPLWAAAWLILAGACDVLDGAVARLGNMRTEFGGVLDSLLDRLSDMALYGGMVLHFALAGNVTYVTLAFLALCNGLMISYVKARAERSIDDCSVGFWQRGERSAALLLAALCSHLPILLWQQAISPFFTVLRRVHYAWAAAQAKREGRPPPPTLPERHWTSRLRPWRYPRGTVPYDLTVGFNIAFFVVLPWIHPVFYGGSDPLGAWLAGIMNLAPC